MLLQQLVNGLLGSGIYALFAVGFTLIFGIMGVLNMTHADFAMISALAIIFFAASGQDPVVAVGLAMALTLIVSLIVERIAMRPGRRFRGDAALEMPLIATIGAGMILQNLAALIFGNKAIVFPMQMLQFVNLHGILVSRGLLVAGVTAVLLLIALEILVMRSDFGRQIRAVAQNRNAALIMGIHADRVILIVVAITALLAAVAGVLVGLSYGMVSPLMGVPYAIKGLVAMIVGGVGSLRGAVLGAVLIGCTEALTVAWFGSSMRDVSVFFVLLAVLALRPGGLIPVPGAR